jgi:hypothetical protein
MYETKETEIDKFKVKVTQWPARKAFKQKLKLIKIFGPSLAEIFSGYKSRKSDSQEESSEIDMSKVGLAIRMLFEKLNEDEMLSLILELFSSTRINDRELTESEFDMIFAGKIFSVYKIIGFVLEVNFGSFFEKGGIGKMMSQIRVTQ